MSAVIQSTKAPLATNAHPVQANFVEFPGVNCVKRVGTIDNTENAEHMRAVLARLVKITNKVRMEPGAQLVDVTLTCPEKTTHHQYWEIPEKSRTCAKHYSKANRSRYVANPVVYQYSTPPPPTIFTAPPPQYSVPPPPLSTCNFVQSQKPPTRTRCPLAIVPPPVTDTSSTFLTPPTSGPSSPTPVPPSPSDTDEPPRFVFNMGVVNAPKAGCRVKISDSEEGFIVCEDKDFQPKKTKIFTSEELLKQSSLVEEWKKRIQEAL